MIMAYGNLENGFFKHQVLSNPNFTASSTASFLQEGQLSRCWKLLLLIMCTPCWREHSWGSCFSFSSFCPGKVEASGEGTPNLLPRRWKLFKIH